MLAFNSKSSVGRRFGSGLHGNVEDLFDDILSFKPDIVGISLNFGEFESS